MHENLLATPVKLKFSTVMMRERKKSKFPEKAREADN